MEHKLIATYTFLTEGHHGTPCNASYVALSCQKGPLTNFLLSTAINVTLLFPGKRKKKNKGKKSATTEKTAQVSIAQKSNSCENCALLIEFSSAIKQTTEG